MAPSMGKHIPRDRHVRSQIAYLAARLMAEDGVTDFSLAKRKAARQAGFADVASLPDNQEVEAALRSYQALYQSAEQPAVLRRLREVAVQAMESLVDFRPYLTGSVLTGTASSHSDVNLQLFADSAKEFEIFLLNRNIRFDMAVRNFRMGEREAEIPIYRFEIENTTVAAALFEPADERIALKYRSDGRRVERARIDEVRAMLAA